MRPRKVQRPREREGVAGDIDVYRDGGRARRARARRPGERLSSLTLCACLLAIRSRASGLLFPGSNVKRLPFRGALR